MTNNDRHFKGSRPEVLARNTYIVDPATGDKWRVEIASLASGLELDVVIANQSYTPATVTSLDSSIATDTTRTVLTANAARKISILYNDSDQPCFVKYGAGADDTDFTIKVEPADTLFNELPVYTGLITVRWVVAATGSLFITEG